MRHKQEGGSGKLLARSFHALARAPDHIQSGASRLSDNLYYTDF